MTVKEFSILPDDACNIRKEVFMTEQGFSEEFDEKDKESTHFVGYTDNEAAAVCRVFYSEENESYMLGRLAVRKKFRGRHLGEEMVLYAEEYIQKNLGKRCIVFAQMQAKNFYKKIGYKEYGEILEDEGCPHIMMKKDFKDITK